MERIDKPTEICEFKVYKDGKPMWINSWTVYDIDLIWEDLAKFLLAKKLESCAWVDRIDYKNQYNGFVKITVWQQGYTVRSIFYVPRH